ncbi:Trypsin-1 [Armadillidium vulgare]|nr:Trypsin-1 [Armadillidium vulgare]
MKNKIKYTIEHYKIKKIQTNLLAYCILNVICLIFISLHYIKLKSKPYQRKIIPLSYSSLKIRKPSLRKSHLF